MGKRFLSEHDICRKFIMPALISTGWNLEAQISEEKTLTAGRISCHRCQKT
jgi:type I restriction enzyme R subunit